MATTTYPRLLPWPELPVWAALLIKADAPVLADRKHWQGFEWVGPNHILVWADGFGYLVVRNNPIVL